MDLWISYRFQLNLKQGTLKVENAEEILNHREGVAVEVNSAKDTRSDGFRGCTSC